MEWEVGGSERLAEVSANYAIDVSGCIVKIIVHDLYDFCLQ